MVSGSFCQVYRVTDEALIAETAVWPNFFLKNIFFALNDSKLFIIIYWINDPRWCNMVQISKGCLNEVIIKSLQEVIKRPLKGNIPVI